MIRSCSRHDARRKRQSSILGVQSALMVPVHRTPTASSGSALPISMPVGMTRGALWMREALLDQPATAWVNRTLAVSYVRISERAAARDSLAAFRTYFPDATIGAVIASIPFTPDFLDRVAEGLDDLGLLPSLCASRRVGAGSSQAFYLRSRTRREQLLQPATMANRQGRTAE
jgi:hypothetical protein